MDLYSKAIIKLLNRDLFSLEIINFNKNIIAALLITEKKH